MFNLTRTLFNRPFFTARAPGRFAVGRSMPLATRTLSNIRGPAGINRLLLANVRPLALPPARVHLSSRTPVGVPFFSLQPALQAATYPAAPVQHVSLLPIVSRPMRIVATQAGQSLQLPGTRYHLPGLGFASKIASAYQAYRAALSQGQIRPPVLGRLIWENPAREAILTENAGKWEAGYHGGPRVDQFIEQAKTNPLGEIDQDVMQHVKMGTDGLYFTPDPEYAYLYAKYAGKNTIAEFGSTCSVGTNEFGQHHTLPGTGKVYLMRLYEINPDRLNWKKPSLLGTQLKACKAFWNALHA